MLTLSNKNNKMGFTLSEEGDLDYNVNNYKV